MSKFRNAISHPLSKLSARNKNKINRKNKKKYYNPYNNTLGDSADFSQYDVIDDKFGSGDYTHDQFVLGDFSCYGSESGQSEETMSGFDDEMLAGYGDYDEGLGKRFRVKFKPKAIVRAIAKPVAKVAQKAVKKTLKVLPVSQIVKPLEKAAREAGRAVNKVVQTVQSALPIGVKQAQEDYSLVEAQNTPSEVVSQGGELTQAQLAPSITPMLANKVASAIVQSKKVSHPLLTVQRRIKGEPMDGFLDDMFTQAKKAATTAYRANKEKLITAGTAQLTNQAGSLLNKLSATSPEAQMAISQVVSTATTAATTAAQENAAVKAKAFYEKNKLVILGGSAALVGLVAFSMLRKK